MRLLVAEDDEYLLKSIVHILKKDSYEVDGVTDGQSAYDYAITNEYDGLIFDIMMPNMDGITCLKLLRKEGINTPALFLTAKTEVEDRVVGLDAGADDYISKPFSVLELLARIRAMLRRKDNFTPDIVKYLEVSLNKSTYEISYNNNIQVLGSKELQIIELLFSRVGTFTTIEQIITHIWGWEAEVDTSVVWVHISNIRKKLELIKAPFDIKFVRNGGYKLESK